jgi:AcrR family transcriptional regulator
MGRPRKFENRYDIILDNAAQLFLEHGFEGTTVDDIARACELGKATIYAEFSSKEELMHAVIVRYIQQAHAEMNARIAEATGNYLGVLRDILLHRVITIYNRANKHFHTLEEMRTVRQEHRNRLKDYRDEEYRILANLLEKAAINGEIAPCSNYFRTAKLLRKGLAGLYPPNIFNISAEEFKQDAHDLINLLLAGLTVPQ